MCAQSCPTLCNPMDCSSPGCSVHGIFPGKNTGVDCHFLFHGIFLTQELNPLSLVSYISRWILYHCATKEVQELGCMHVCACVHTCLATQSCLTLCEPLDYTPPRSSVHGIFQARILDWSRLSGHSPGDLPDPGIEPTFPVSPALQADS